MKKFLSVISLMLVALMIVAIPVSAEEIPDVYSGTLTMPKTDIRYATNVAGNTPNIDGVINEGEYGAPIRIETPKPVKNEDWGGSWETAAIDTTLESEYMDFYFAYDEENIYIAIKDYGPAYIEDGDQYKINNIPYRHNYRFQLGFDLADVTSYFQFGGGNTSWDNEAAWPGLAYFEFGSKKTAPIKTYDLVSECIVQEINEETGEVIAYGDLVSASGIKNYTDGPWALTMEFKLDKAVIADCLNQTYYTDYETISDAMWFAFTTNAYRDQGGLLDDEGNEKLGGETVTQYVRWMGQTDITDKQAEYEAYGLYEGATRDWFFDLVVFADQGAEIQIANPFPTRPETEAPVVEETEAEVVETEAEVEETAGEATEAVDTTETPAAGGCGGAVSFAGIALVAALGTCTAFVAKKKED